MKKKLITKTWNVIKFKQKLENLNSTISSVYWRGEQRGEYRYMLWLNFILYFVWGMIMNGNDFEREESINII